MKKILLLFAYVLSPVFQMLSAQNIVPLVDYTVTDSLTVTRILAVLSHEKALSTGDLMVKAGRQLIGLPYVASTLEKGDKEHLIVNLSGLDCTTFAENCLALARAAQHEQPDFGMFVNELLKIRYRGGLLVDYTSRLHYFSDWIFDNEAKGIVKNETCAINNDPFIPMVYFMSRHADKYVRLHDNPEFISKMSGQENLINGRKLCYIPKNKVASLEYLLHDGDVIGITTNMAGLDIQHVVLAIRRNGKIHLLHASQRYGKVMISTETLSSYLKYNKTATGIVVARPL